MDEGVVARIFVAGRAAERLQPVERVEAIEGAGLAGDRYAAGRGTYSGDPKPGRHVTLIEAEALDALEAEVGMALSPADARRNVVTRGIALGELIGRTFTIGEVELAGVRECAPCVHLQRLTGVPVVRGLADGRGGLRADIVRGGTFAVGDPIRLVG